ncbi:hypothetical protein GOODEAATRI_007840 [Goodea atripinnis]|uniref:Uncharacterized protein n=1 Tax=Goodea atripinnis TaxID=208336 RepID=A0ABV0MT74_9TELE
MLFGFHHIQLPYLPSCHRARCHSPTPANLSLFGYSHLLSRDNHLFHHLPRTRKSNSFIYCVNKLFKPFIVVRNCCMHEDLKQNQHDTCRSLEGIHMAGTTA